MKIKKGDLVLIISGKDRGKKGKVIQTFLEEEKLLVEGVNFRKRHVKPKKQGEKGQIVTVPSPIFVSNVKFVCPKCKKISRVGYKMTESKKYRICKKCKQEI